VARTQRGPRGSNPAPGCFIFRGRDSERPLTCDAESPTLTTRDRRVPAVPDAVRTQHGPAPHPYQDRPGDAFKLEEGECPSSSLGASDRGCPLGSGFVRPIGHATGTGGKGKRGGSHQPSGGGAVDQEQQLYGCPVSRRSPTAQNSYPMTGLGGVLNQMTMLSIRKSS
jgi:hypothetical protein